MVTIGFKQYHNYIIFYQLINKCKIKFANDKFTFYI